MQRRVISISPYNNETHMLDIRVGVLRDVVDKFYIVEATQTHQGKPKDCLRVYNDPKVEVVTIDFPDNLGNWGRENYQRDYIIELSEYNDDDIVLVTDLDEVPNPDKIELLKEIFDPEFSYSLNMKIYQYYLNNENVTEGIWEKAKACSVGRYRSQGFIATDLRLHEMSINVPNAGWHWTFCGGKEFIRNKIESYAHAEFNNNETKSQIEQRIAENLDTLGRPFELIAMSIDSDEFPEYVCANRESLKQYIKET